MDTLKPLGPQKPFELPSHLDLWIEVEQRFADLHVFKVHLQCDGLCRTLESKAFNPRRPEETARAWLEFMSLTGNIIVTSVMPPDILHKFQPVEGGGMHLIEEEEE